MGVKFNGHDLDDICICGKPNITALNSEATYSEEARGRGKMLLGRKWGATEISFPVVFKGTTAERRAKVSTLGSWLAVDEPKRLVLPDMPSWWYMAVPDGKLALERNYDADTAELRFTMTDPAAYSGNSSGGYLTASVPSGGSATFTVGGTAPTMPVVYCGAATRNSDTLLWGVQAGNGDFVHVFTGSASNRMVTIDCDAKTANVSTSSSSTNVLLTLDSDWLELYPGSNTVTMDEGTGSATVRWYERWL